MTPIYICLRLLTSGRNHDKLVVVISINVKPENRRKIQIKQSTVNQFRSSLVIKTNNAGRNHLGRNLNYMTLQIISKNRNEPDRRLARPAPGKGFEKKSLVQRKEILLQIDA